MHVGAGTMSVILTALLTATWPRIAAACSPVIDEVAPPAAALPFDAGRAPAPPKPVYALVSPADGAGCGEPCPSWAVLSVGLAEMPDPPLVRVVLPDGRAHHLQPRVASADDPAVAAEFLVPWPEVEVPPELVLETVTYEGYPSMPAAVAVSGQDDGGCRLAREIGSSLPIAIGVALLLVWRRRRRVDRATSWRPAEPARCPRWPGRVTPPVRPARRGSRRAGGASSGRRT